MVKYYRDMTSEERKNLYIRSGYVQDLLNRSEDNYFYKDALKNVEKYKDTYIDKKGVLRWKSVDRVPPKELLLLWKYKKKRFDLDLAFIALERDTTIALNGYRKSQENVSKEVEEERLREMRAAFGTGVDVVDVITGKRIRT